MTDVAHGKSLFAEQRDRRRLRGVGDATEDEVEARAEAQAHERVDRDALGLPQLEDWSSDQGRVLLLDAGRATLELFDEAQAAMVDDLEALGRIQNLPEVTTWQPSRVASKSTCLT